MEGTTSSLEVMPPGTPTCISPDLSQHEPPMHIPRPSSDRAQDVSHILASVFRDLYTRDVMSKDTVQNLTRSSEGSSKFHKKCMTQLTQVHMDHQKKLDEYNTMERHIIQARARATSADEKALRHVAGDVGGQKYEQLGLPPVASHFRWCLAEDKLKSHKVIVPSDIFTSDHQLIDGPKKSNTPHFSIPTLSSSLHFLKETTDDGYFDENDSFVKSKTQLQEEDVTVTTLSSDSIDLCSVPPQKPASHKVKGDLAKDQWRENMRHETRIEDRALLARLEERHNFLKNPRFLPLSEPRASRLLTKDQPKQKILKAGREVAQELMTEENIQVFAANPPVVTFTEWSVGRVYEAILELRNVSTVSRQLRVLPPKTSYFSLGLGKYPGSEGLVAPGISTQYNVRFMPESLSDYEDKIQVISQAACPLVVKVKAKRTPPALTISDKIQCGYCLVSGVKRIELPIKNVGGNGRFCILKKCMWPAANFKTVVNPSCLDLGVFQIRPSVFEVLAGERISLELLFAPDEIKDYSEDLVLICDNCQVKYFTIQGCGESAAVELVSVSDGGEEPHRVGEISDLTANHLVRFPSLNPHSFYMKQIIIHNSTNVEMPFSWHILKPNLRSALDTLSVEDINWENFEFYPDPSSPFFVEPRSGNIQPNGIHEFVITFAPNQVGDYTNVFHLVLSNVPDNKQQVTIAKVPSSASSEAVEKSSHANRDESAPRLSRSSSGVQFASVPKVASLREVISLEIEVQGQSIPYSVLLHPPAIVVPGSVLVGATVRRPLRMANYSLAPVQFQWDSESTPNIVEVKPPMGLIDPGEVTDLEVTLTGSKPGPLTCDLTCSIEHQDQPMKLSVAAEIKGPEVVIDNLSINYGLIQLGTSVTEKLYIRNTTQLNARWNLIQADNENSGLVVWPSYGELQSLGKQEVTVTFKPTFCQSLNTFLNLEVFGGRGLSVAVRGEVQTQQVCFEDCTLVLQETFLSVPKTSTVKLINQTLFPTSFMFEKSRGNKSCDADAYPPTGVLGPREERLVEITFTSNVNGEVTDLYLPCKIEGMKHPVVLGFYANVLGLSVELSTPGFDGTDLKLDYGPYVGKLETSKVLVTNLTAIRAPWTASVQNFKSRPPLPRQPAHDFKSVKSRRAMLGRTPNLADPLAKSATQAMAEHSKLMLRDGRGLAFAVEPERGFLEPYQSQEINVTAYSDMWGRYNDVFTCQIEGLEAKTIPIEANVVGSPLTFQVANDNQKAVVVRYGTRLEGGSPVTRKLRINNTSPHDVRLDWRTFNYPEPDDKKIIDFKIWFGEAFPLLTEKTSDVSFKSSLRHLSEIPDSPTSQMTLSVDSTPRFKQLPKLVNVRIEPHLGERCDTPYRIEPPQVIVPAQGHVTISALFNPVIGQCDSKEGRECLAYALGYMTLDSSDVKEEKDKVTRGDGYAIAPLRLEMTSLVRPGMLRIEMEDEEEQTSFHIPLSHLDTEQQGSRQACTLGNPTETTLSFSLSVRKPFFLLANKKKAEHLARNLLRPQDNLKVR
ncbi:unnamed protein product [Clavelina lepadiformis]|uniref:MSP domain-containing protein n=1 Tax=Clavelina lepadiformis TaxID=159417 RepID=A0ABP0GCX3_CLALP